MKTNKYNLNRIEKNMIISALNHHEGNRTYAAKDLGIHVRTLRNRLHHHNIAGYLLKSRYKKKAKMKRYWATWKTPSDYFNPSTYPPTPAIKGWWEVSTNNITGESTLCGIVDADSIKDATTQIVFDWPESRDFQFCKMTSVNWHPSKKYKLKSWMKERLNEA